MVYIHDEWSGDTMVSYRADWIGLTATIDYSKPELLKLLVDRLARASEDELDVHHGDHVQRARRTASGLDERRN